MTKHIDGFALWPTAVPHPLTPSWHIARDVVGELDAAVRARCMRMGLYYSGLVSLSEWIFLMYELAGVRQR